MAEDLTPLLLRDEELEQRSDTSFKGLFIAFQHGHIIVRGQLYANSGTLKEDIILAVSAYDLDGRVVGTSSELFKTDSFHQFVVFSIQMEVLSYPLSQVLIYPRLMPPRPKYGRRRR